MVLWVSFGSCNYFELSESFDFEKLDADEDIVDRNTTESRQHFETFRLLSTVHEMSWRLRHEQKHPCSEHYSRKDLNADGD